MIEKIEGIITDIVKHTDRHNVVTVYTRNHGRLAFLVPVRTTKAGRLRNAIIQPMAVISADVNIRKGNELYTLRQLNPTRLWHGLYSHPLKCGILYFLTEFINRLIRQYPPDRHLYEFLCQSIADLDKTENLSAIANFHIAFLIRLLPLAGIMPSLGERNDGERFDLLSGEMIHPSHLSPTIRSQMLSEEDSNAVRLLLRMNYQNMSRYRFTRHQRNRLLDYLLVYYSVHLPIGREYKTLNVLREIYD